MSQEFQFLKKEEDAFSLRDFLRLLMPYSSVERVFHDGHVLAFLDRFHTGVHSVVGLDHYLDHHAAACRGHALVLQAELGFQRCLRVLLTLA